MSKKKKGNKKPQKKSISILKEMDDSINQTYDSLVEEIQAYQERLYIEDRKIDKKAKRKHKKGKEYDVKGEKKKVRKSLIDEMDGKTFFDRVKKVLDDIGPVIVLIARLIASLICAILQIDAIKVMISPELLAKINSIYSACMGISATGKAIAAVKA